MKLLAKSFCREIPLYVIVVLLFIISLTGFQPSQAQSYQNDHSKQWEVHSPGGETSCADGSEFKFHTREGKSDRLLVYFTGGGACWTGEQCDTETDPTPFAYNLSNNDPKNKKGIFNLSHPDNPFTDYTMVYVPTCTGDVVLGDSVATYRYRLEAGPGDFPVTYLILYEIRDRLEAHHSDDSIIVEFNNQDERSFQDKKHLIDYVENEIDTKLNK